MRISIITCLLVVSAFATNVREQEINEIIVLAQTGATPGQIVADRLDQHILNIRNEQTDHDDLMQVQKRICDEELGFRKNEISTAADAEQRATENRQKCNTAFILAKSDIATFNRYKTIFEEELEYIKKKREEGKAAFDRKVQNFNYALETIEQCEPIIAQWQQNQGSFVQVTQHVNKMFIQAAKSGYTQELALIIGIMTEMSSAQPGEVSTDLADRLRNLLATIRQKIQQALSDLTEEENQSIAEFNDRRERDVRLLEQINDLLIHLREYSESQEKCINLQNDIINAASSKRSRNQYMQDYTLDMCSAFAAEYTESSQTRTRQIDTLQKLRKFVLAKQQEYFGSLDGQDIQNVFSVRVPQQQQASFVQLSANLRNHNN